MPIAKFSVTEVRVAATCPRITYFDAEHTRRHDLKHRSVTRIWRDGDCDVTACGTLFHNAVESFNARAATAPEVRQALTGPADRAAIERGLRSYMNLNCVDLAKLASKPVEQQQAFTRALGTYMGEMVDIVADALGRGKPAGEIIEDLFGDRRRRVDVSFAVGPHGEPVRVTGVLDYVFHDWRLGNCRIIDYKLTPANSPGSDLFQVSLYALMHHAQHHTEPDVGVLYLHPERRMVSLTWDQVRDQRHKLFDLLASMAGWVDFEEKRGVGLRPPGEPSYCPCCKWDKECADRLGPKHLGERLRHWTQPAGKSAEPTVEELQITKEVPPVVEPLPTAARETKQPAPKPVVVERPSIATDVLRVGDTVHGQRPVGLPIGSLPTHVAVVGAAGSGKTWMAKVVAEEAVRLGVPVLAIDPQGDLVQFLRPSNRGGELTAEEQALRDEFLGRVEPRVFTPGSGHARRLSLDPVRLPDRAEWGRIAAEDREGLLVGAAAHLVGLARIGGETDSQQTFLLQVLRGLTAGEGGAVDLAAIVEAINDPYIAGIDDPDRFIKKAERQKLGRKLNGLRFGPSAVLYEGGERLDLDALRRPGEAGKTPLNVIYLNALPDDDQKQLIVASVAAEVYRWMVSSLESTGRPNLLFYLDEAKDFIPAGTQKTPAKDPLIRLFSQGRKFGVACLLCTQSPRSVDYNVFSNCSTKLIGRLESAQDAQRVGEWFSRDGARPAWVDGRSGAEPGSFVGRWPGQPRELEGRPIRSRPLFSLHEGAWSPDRLERESAGGG